MKIYDNAVAQIGETVMIRVYRQINGEFDEIAQDVEFLVDKLGAVSEIFALQAKDNYIISIKHKNNGISHISLHISNNIKETVFKFEIVGKKGLIEYDSTKAAIFTAEKNVSFYESGRELGEFSADVKNIMEAVKKSLATGNKVVLEGGAA